MSPLPYLARILVRKRLRLLEARALAHRTKLPAGEMSRLQLDAVNRAWEDALRRFRFYREWQRSFGLPDRLGSLGELSSFPVLRKAQIQEAQESIFADAGRCRVLITGGSTGQPVRFPASRDDLSGFFANAWTGRSWLGIRPFDRVLFLWGHAHLLGGSHPAGRALARRLRDLKDRAMNTRRLDAYRLNRDSAARYVDALRADPGAVVIAYASAFEKLLDELEEEGVRTPPWAPSHVILTAERVEPSTLERIRETLGSVPAVEYGTGELGVMAYSTRDCLDLEFLWRSFHVGMGEEDEIIVTTLDPRLFPLFHYGTGDRAAGVQGEDQVVVCKEILGRRNDAVRLPRRGEGPLEVHSELLTHAVKTLAGVRSFLVVDHEATGELELRLLTDPGDLERAGSRVMRALEAEVPSLDAARVRIGLLEEEPLTLAGKRKFIERVPAEAP